MILPGTANVLLRAENIYGLQLLKSLVYVPPMNKDHSLWAFDLRN